MDYSRRYVLAGASGTAFAVALAAARPAHAQGEVFTPERFGAKGDGVTNDTEAFERLARAVQANGGGTIHLRKAVYIVGAQRRRIGANETAFLPSGILGVRGCNKPLQILGNGAALGLRYGTFGRIDHGAFYTGRGGQGNAVAPFRQKSARAVQGLEPARASAV